VALPAAYQFKHSAEITLGKRGVCHNTRQQPQAIPAHAHPFEFTSVFPMN
jgi:hypothetical protein